MRSSGNSNEPAVGDYVVSQDTVAKNPGDFTVLILRVTESGLTEGNGGGWLEQIERVEERAQYLAADAEVAAWRLVGGVYTLLPPASPSRTKA